MKWKLPPKIKIYEALGCLADKRIKIEGNQAQVLSSSRQKKYLVKYDRDSNAIMANDNGSYWQGYLGYPAIAFLLDKKIIKYDSTLATALKEIAWNDINTKFKNDYKKTEEYVLNLVKQRGVKPPQVVKRVETIYNSLKEAELNLLGKKIKPPLKG